MSATKSIVRHALVHLGPFSQRELGEKIFKTSGNITMVVDDLERSRMIRRGQYVHDPRR